MSSKALEDVSRQSIRHRAVSIDQRVVMEAVAEMLERWARADPMPAPPEVLMESAAKILRNGTGGL